MNEKVIKKMPSSIIPKVERTFEVKKLIEKALTFYCEKYKKRFNFKMGISEVLANKDDNVISIIRFKYDNRSYFIKLFELPEETVTDVVDKIIKEADWNNDKLINDALNKVKKTIN